jgi:hypothetical protein
VVLACMMGAIVAAATAVREPPWPAPAHLIDPQRTREAGTPFGAAFGPAGSTARAP